MSIQPSRPSDDQQVMVSMRGMSVPAIGFGTYRLQGNECFTATKTALAAGYRHIDTAMAYDNEAAVGRAIAASAVDRDELFLTTKIKGYPRYLSHDALIEAAHDCLDRLGVEYVDLLLVHWWHESADMSEVFGAMEQLQNEGLIRHTGVSNFSVDQLDRAIAASPVPIVTNQVEYHPYFSQDELLSYCREHEVLLTAYSPLLGGGLVGDEVLATIGRRYGKTPAQVAIRWLLQQENVITIPKASSEGHMRENMAVFDFSLTDAEMRQITDVEGPLLYRLTAEGGPINRFRARIGPYVPERLRATIS